jgi:hypothetical protein
VPTESLDDPNAIATPLPWVDAIGTSLFAGTWEEAIFRAVPLALLSLWVRDRPGRRWWMAAGVVVTSLAFGFGHANYPSWPPYSRGVELFAEAALWAGALPARRAADDRDRARALRPGLVRAVRAARPRARLPHVGGGGRRRGRAPGARGRRGVVAGARGGRRRGRGAAARRLAAGRGPVEGRRDRRRRRPGRAGPRDGCPARGRRRPTRAPEAPLPAAARASGRLRAAAAAVVVLGLAAALASPADVAGPRFTAPRGAVAGAADSALRARGVDPAGWSRTVVASGVDHPAERRFLRDTVGRVQAAALARRLASTYLVPAQWDARYVRRGGTLAERREGWRVLLYPDGRVRRVVHEVAEDAPGGAPPPDSARALALAAVRRGVAGPGVDAARLTEAELAQRPRPRRLDTRVGYIDAATALPGGATARVEVSLAGDEAVDGGRGVRLPDAWHRRDADRSSRQTLVVGVALVAVFGGLVTLVVRGVRRPPALPAVVTRRRAVLVGVAAGLVSLAGTVNALPSAFAAWDTAQPWSTYVGTTALGVVLAAAVAGLAAGALWAGADALRRRAGVRFWPAAVPHGAAAGGPARDGHGGGVRDALLLGAALGLTPAAFDLLAPLARAGAWPDAPATALDALAPWAVHAAGAVRALVWAPAAALPALALAAGLRTPRARLAALGAAAVVLGGAAAVGGAGGEVSAPVGFAASVGGVAVLALVVWAFGRQSALAWLAAPPAAAVALGLAGARAAGNGGDAAASLLGAAAAAALLAALYRWARAAVTGCGVTGGRDDAARPARPATRARGRGPCGPRPLAGRAGRAAGYRARRVKNERPRFTPKRAASLSKP